VASLKELILESVEYVLPLSILDTFHVKTYVGVDAGVLKEKARDWIQVSSMQQTCDCVLT